MNKLFTIIALAIFLIIGGSWWSKLLQSKDVELVSANGVHWHAELEIYAKGNKIEVPNGIGLTGGHQPIHTHDDAPVVHLEFPGRTVKDDLKLGNFFRNWGKDFMSFGPSVKMIVNGTENTEYENYIMQDKDKIELYYE